MSKRDSLTLRRVGEFAFKVSGPNHCGIAPEGQHQQAAYVVVVKCTTKLDARNFLFEQRSIDEYFQKIRHVQSSCEKLTMIAATELVVLIMRENPGCEIKWIEVQIMAAPGAASMTYRHHP